MVPSVSQLRILLSAYACEPGKGSEPGVGWNVARELSSRVQLTVVTRDNNREPVLSSGEEWVKSVNWIFWDPPKWLTFWKKGGRGIQLFYVLWQAGVASAVKRRVSLTNYEVAHHLTFGKYWVPSSLATLPLPFVFGPVGGGEISPPGLTAGQSLRGRCAEFSKLLARRFVAWFPPSRWLLRRAVWTYAATPQTADALRKAGVKRVSVLPQSGIRPEEFGNFPAQSDKGPDGILKLVTASRLIHWKAIDLAIEAVARLPRTTNVQLVILQSGPEEQRLRDLVARLGVVDRVVFKGRLANLEVVYGEIASADALVHPALHEAFGQACLEALALGVPVICLNWGGPGLIVDAETGFAVEPGTREETIERLAQAMVDLATERKNGHSRVAACKARAFSEFHWEKLADAMVEKYDEVTNSR